MRRKRKKKGEAEEQTEKKKETERRTDGGREGTEKNGLIKITPPFHIDHLLKK